MNRHLQLMNIPRSRTVINYQICAIWRISSLSHEK